MLSLFISNTQPPAVVLPLLSPEYPHSTTPTAFGVCVSVLIMALLLTIVYFYRKYQELMLVNRELQTRIEQLRLVHIEKSPNGSGSIRTREVEK